MDADWKNRPDAFYCEAYRCHLLLAACGHRQKMAQTADARGILMPDRAAHCLNCGQGKKNWSEIIKMNAAAAGTGPAGGRSKTRPADRDRLNKSDKLRPRSGRHPEKTMIHFQKAVDGIVAETAAATGVAEKDVRNWTHKRTSAVLAVRREIICRIREQHPDLSKEEIGRLLKITPITVSKYLRRQAADSADGAGDRPRVLIADPPEHVLMLDFTGYEDLLKKLNQKAKDKMRKPAQQALWLIFCGLNSERERCVPRTDEPT